jgi:hypothetical protein
MPYPLIVPLINKYYPIMKNLFLAISFGILTLAGQAQTGLDSIIVEKYYVSDANDSIGSSGILPVGSVTYRLYVDMAPGYNFQMAYGSPTHPLFITTSTSFFNNTDYGTYTPTFSSGNAKKNTVMLDSWLSTGAACSGYWGVLKSEDDGVNTFVNKDLLLQNDNSFAGVPLTSQDGMIAGIVPSFSTIGGVNTDVFNDGTADGNSFLINDGSWYFLGGVVGPTVNNRVLLAQITTNGVFQYELNVLLGKDLGGGMSLSEKYVAANPVSDEISDSKYKLTGMLTPPVPVIIGVNQLKTSDSQILVYPNPVSEFVTLDIRTSGQNKTARYKLINMEGQVLLSKTVEIVSGNYVENIPVSSYVTGIYTVLVSADGMSTARKIIKK